MPRSIVFTTNTPTLSRPEDSEEMVCFSQGSSPGQILTESALFSKRPVQSPRRPDPGNRQGVEGGREEGREERRENCFGLFYPELRNKHITYRYYANVSTTCQQSMVR